MRAGTIGGWGRRAPALMCAVAVAATASAANADTLLREAGTTVTISSRVPAFNGKIKSGADGCESGRRIQLFRRGGGDSGDRLIGRDRSNSRGRWEIPADPLRSGAYYAKAKPTRVGSVVCGGGRSGVVVVD